MKTQRREPTQSRPDPATSAVPPEDEDTFGPVDEPTENQPAPLSEPPRENPWRSMDEAPKDRIIRGRLSLDDEAGIPIRWRNSRHRGRVEGKIGFHWIPGGVWHAAETAGAVQLHPIEWREWTQADFHLPERESAEAA